MSCDDLHTEHALTPTAGTKHETVSLPRSPHARVRMQAAWKLVRIPALFSWKFAVSSCPFLHEGSFFNVPLEQEANSCYSQADTIPPHS